MRCDPEMKRGEAIARTDSARGRAKRSRSKDVAREFGAPSLTLSATISAHPEAPKLMARAFNKAVDSTPPMTQPSHRDRAFLQCLHHREQRIACIAKVEHLAMMPSCETEGNDPWLVTTSGPPACRAVPPPSLR
jgi:hypothetical protein